MAAQPSRGESGMTFLMKEIQILRADVRQVQLSTELVLQLLSADTGISQARTSQVGTITAHDSSKTLVEVPSEFASQPLRQSITRTFQSSLEKIASGKEVENIMTASLLSSPMSGKTGSLGSRRQVSTQGVFPMRLENGMTSPISSRRQSERKASDLSTAAAVFSEGDDRGRATHSEALVSGLPQGWPATIRMRKGLESSEGMAHREREMHSKLTRGASIKTLQSKSLKVRGRKSGITTRTSTIMSTALDPDSRLLVSRDMIGSLVLMFDVILSPFLMAFETSVHHLILVLLILSITYWAADMLLGFRTGFYHKGHLQMQPVQVAKHYLRTNFLIDSALLACDITATILVSTSPDHRLIFKKGGFVFASKLLRSPRIFMYWRAFRVLEVAFPWSATTVRLVTSLTKVIISTLIFAHIMTCLWYAVGDSGPSDTGYRWLEATHTPEVISPQVGSEPLVVRSYDGLPFGYLTAMHWSLAQITLGAMEVTPTNSLERLLSIFLLLFGLVFGSVVVSLVSSQTMEYVMLRREQTQKLTVLRAFLKQHSIDTKLAARVQRQVASRLADHSVPLSDQDVPALSMLSVGLRLELLRETRLPLLIGHPLFRTWAGLDRNALEALCDEAIRFASYVPQDVIFIPRTVAAEALLVVHGLLRYSQDSETSLESSDITIEVKEGAWICEAGLWTHWTHVGKLEAEIASQLLVISATDVLQILNRYTVVAYVTRYYGRNYHIRVISAVPPHASWPNDLQVPFTDPSDLLTADVGIGMLEQARKNGLLEDMDERIFEKLTKEVQDEVCAIQQGDEDQIQRIVALVAVRLFSVSGRMLVQLAKAEDGQAPKPSCQLPGTKRPRGEMPTQALDKLFSTTLSPFCSIIEIDFSEEQVEVIESESYGIETKYLKTVYTAHLSSELLEEEAVGHTILPHTFPETGNYLTWSERYKDIVENEVFVITEKKRKVLCAWLPADDFDYLKSEHGHHMLAEWIRNLSKEAEFTSESLGSAGTGQVNQDEEGRRPSETSLTSKRQIANSMQLSGSRPLKRSTHSGQRNSRQMHRAGTDDFAANFSEDVEAYAHMRTSSSSTQHQRSLKNLGYRELELIL